MAQSSRTHVETETETQVDPDANTGNGTEIPAGMIDLRAGYNEIGFINENGSSWESSANDLFRLPDYATPRFVAYCVAKELGVGRLQNVTGNLSDEANKVAHDPKWSPPRSVNAFDAVVSNFIRAAVIDQTVEDVKATDKVARHSDGKFHKVEKDRFPDGSVAVNAVVINAIVAAQLKKHQGSDRYNAIVRASIASGENRVKEASEKKTRGKANDNLNADW